MEIVTPEKCQEIANSYYQQVVQVTGYEVLPCEGEKKGHLADYYTLLVNVKDQSALKFFVKCLLKNANRPEYIDLVTSKEVAFYKCMGVDLNAIPRCYYSSQKLIVMEDLSENGYKLAQHFDLAHAKVALKTLAKFHASTIARAGFEDEGFLHEGMFSMDVNAIYLTGLTKGVVDLLESEYFFQCTPNLTQLFNEHVEQTLDIINNENSYIKVCCHGDLWKNNILFKYDNGIPIECKLVDFQLTRHAPPAHDVTTLIYHNSNTHGNTDELLYYYYYECLRNITDALSGAEYKETCKIYLSVAKITKILYAAFEAATKLRKSKSSKQPLNEIMQTDNYIESIISIDDELRQRFRLQLQEIKDLLLKTLISEQQCTQILNSIMKSKSIYRNHTVRALISNLHIKTDNYKLRIQEDSKEFNFLLKKNEEGVIRFYSAIVKRYESNNINLTKRIVPRCYLLEADTVVIEDLTNIGYEFINERKPFSLDEIKVVINIMTKLHAAGFMHDSKDLLTTENELKLKMGEIGINEQQEQHQTLCHGYLSHSSIMMKYADSKPVDCKFINFNSYHYAPPAQDVLIFLYLTTLKTLRQYTSEHIFDYYYTRLQEEMSEHIPFTRKDFMDSCNKQKDVALVHAAVLNGKAGENYVFVENFSEDELFEKIQKIL